MQNRIFKFNNMERSFHTLIYRIEDKQQESLGVFVRSFLFYTVQTILTIFKKFKPFKFHTFMCDLSLYIKIYLLYTLYKQVYRININVAYFSYSTIFLDNIHVTLHRYVDLNI